MDFKVEQRVRKIQFIHKMIYHPKHHLLIQALIEWYQVSSGLPYPILSQPNPAPNYINNVWFQDLIQFMADNNIKIITQDFFCNRPQRKNDKCIMYEIIKQKLTINQLIQINACRIHLQVSFISDMTRPNGKDIFSEFLRGERTTQVTSNHGWPKQESPSPNAKKLWSKTIREIFQLNSGSLPIIHRLKEWIQPIHSRHTLHAWYHSAKS